MTVVQRILPSWFKQKIPNKNKIDSMKESFAQLGIYTVCEHSYCPNMGSCWSAGVATFMILGDRCTRACRFCAVESGQAKEVDPFEPCHVAQAVKRLGLKYVVVTSVTRDDLEDQGAAQFSKTIQEIKASVPGIRIEVLVPDFLGNENLIKIVLDAEPSVFGHNLETVKRLSTLFRPQADYERSLNVLRLAKQLNPGIFTKSGLMVGLGETKQEVKQAMRDLRAAGCDLLTIGQYLAPSKKERHVCVDRFVLPDEFKEYKTFGMSIGFGHVLSGPLVRSSYLAEDGYQNCLNRLKGLDI
ncbi:MAG: lipoyl synthase [Candidatus Omnitrophica bacterium]|nr:lipoyl synthase [Candidatus Omnitrophota bacterium]